MTGFCTSDMLTVTHKFDLYWPEPLIPYVPESQTRIKVEKLDQTEPAAKLKKTFQALVDEAQPMKLQGEY